MKPLRTERSAVPTGRPEQAASARWALAALALAVLLPSLGTGIANVGLPTLAKEFGASFQEVQWVVLAYLLAVTTLVVGAGRLGDLTGRRRLLLAGILLFTAASVLCGLAPTLPLLIAARAVQGLGAAVMTALTTAFVAEAVPAARTGRAMGLLGTVSAVGTALGPSLGGALISGPGWRTVFLVNAPLGLLALVLARRHLPADPHRPAGRRPGFDHPGTLLLALTLGAYALAMTTGSGGGPLGAALLLAAAVGAVLFLRTEARSASPLVRPAVLRDPVLLGYLVPSALVSAVMMATLVVGPFHLSRALGLDAALVGLASSAGPLVAALTGVPAGRVADRFGTRRTTAAGLTATAAGSLALTVVPTSFGIAGYLVPLAVVTAGYAVFQTANTTAVMAGAPADGRGVVSGLLTLSRNLGLVTGASAMGAVFALASGSADPATAAPGAVATGTRVTFAVAAVLLAVALAVAARRPARALPRPDNPHRAPRLDTSPPGRRRATDHLTEGGTP
ncbi:MFS transporter [Kitasatospora sp. NBC_01539]|uniref:MFS transporter n=1 Tax=Kitasatospora sp. NBC_01539 TaxID=2903577 RepID=UPI0038602440